MRYYYFVLFFFGDPLRIIWNSKTFSQNFRWKCYKFRLLCVFVMGVDDSIFNFPNNFVSFCIWSSARIAILQHCSEQSHHNQYATSIYSFGRMESIVRHLIGFILYLNSSMALILLSNEVKFLWHFSMKSSILVDVCRFFFCYHE